jgi:hypothetical protein
MAYPGNRPLLREQWRELSASIVERQYLCRWLLSEEIQLLDRIQARIEGVSDIRHVKRFVRSYRILRREPLYCLGDPPNTAREVVREQCLWVYFAVANRQCRVTGFQVR